MTSALGKNCIVVIFSVFQGPSGADGSAGCKGLTVRPGLSVQLMTSLQLSNFGSLPQAAGFNRIKTHYFSFTRQHNIKCGGFHWLTSRQTKQTLYQNASNVLTGQNTNCCQPVKDIRYPHSEWQGLIRVYVSTYVYVSNIYCVYILYVV